MPSKEERHMERAGRVPSVSCQCSGCLGLAKRYKSDSDLLAFYRRRLLQMGWAGKTDDVEKAYMTAHAGWYRAMQESGARLAQSSPVTIQEHLRRARVALGREASDAEDEELPTPGDGGQLDRTSQGQDGPSGEEAPAVQGTLPL